MRTTMTHTDYNKVQLLFEQITNILNAHEFTDNFSDEEWFSTLGAWQSCGDGIRAKCDKLRRPE